MWGVVVGLALAALACAPEEDGPARADRPPARHDGDAWRVIAQSPLESRYGYDAVWTGDDMIVWGGGYTDPETLDFVEQRGGAAYDPRRDRWREIPEAPIPGGFGYSATWTGEEMLVWGDPDDGRSTKGNRGAAFDPATNDWRRIPPGPLAGRSGYLAVWTGEELFVWGGRLTEFERERYDGRGAAYDPAAGRWRELPAAPLPAGYDTMGAWTGAEVLVMTTPMGTEPQDYPKFDELAAYDPAADSWRSLARPSHVSSVGPPINYVDGKLAVLSLSGPVDGGEVGNYGRGYETGGIYDYATGTWSSHADPPRRPAQTWEQTALGDEIVVDGLAYRPSTDAWRTLPEFPLRAREFPVLVWTGEELIVWGGAETASGGAIVDPPPPLDDGAAYTPPG